jgi:hypothetical protein
MSEEKDVSQIALAEKFKQGDDSKQLSVYGVAIVSAFVCLVVCVSILAVYHSIFSQKQKIGMVDIAGILETSELMFTDMLTKPNVNDVDRQSAYDMVKQTGPRLDAAISELQRSCDCLLVTKAAVIGNAAIDYTLQVKAMMGIDKVDVKSIQARVRDVINTKKQTDDMK